ncbi:ribonuclease H-like domain-containing protein [Tanacetum coccineum]
MQRNRIPACRNDPASPTRSFSSHKKYKKQSPPSSTSNPPLAIDYSDDIVINASVLKALDILKSATMTSPPLLEFGSPLDEKMMITDSPYLVTKGGEDDRVDELAEEYIRRVRVFSDVSVNDCDDIVINFAVYKALNMVTNASPLSITDSPMQVTNGGEDGQVDEAAEKFIRRFYNDLRREN